MNEPQDRNVFLSLERAKSSRRRVMWSSVIVLSLIIIVLWGWSLKLQMAFFELKATPEGKLIERTKIDWNKAFEDTKADEQSLNDAKMQVQKALSEFAKNNTSSTQSHQLTATSTTGTLQR